MELAGLEFGFWIELTNMRKYKHEIFRWNYVNLITCIHSNPMFFWYCSLISDIQIATCSRNSKNQTWNIMKILKYFPANGRFSTQGSRDQNRSKFWNFRTEPNQDQSEFKTEQKARTNKYRLGSTDRSMDSWFACDRSASNRFLTFGW